MLKDTLESLFPGIRAGIDVTLQDDGAGPYIKAWHYDGHAQPTDAQIAAAAPAAELAAAQAAALTAIDIAAGAERAKYITVTPGQDMTYLEKVTQAKAFQADGAPTAEKYPLVYGEVPVTAADAAGVAAVFLANYASWQQIGAAIEKVRLTAKKAVTAAATADAVTAVLDGLAWPAA